MSGSLSFASGDLLTVSLGGANIANTDAFTLLAVVKPTLPGSGSPNFITAGSNNCNLGVQYVSASPRVSYWNGSSQFNNSGVVIPDVTWQVDAVTKAAGTAAPRFHEVAVGGAASHGASGSTSAGQTVTTSWKVGSTLTFLCAAVAIWKSVLSDANIEACVTWAAIQALTPSESWRLDGSSPFNGTVSSTQSALTGTSHSTDEPTGFWGTPTAGMVPLQAGLSMRGLTPRYATRGRSR